MSNQNYYDQSQHPQQQNLQSNNPFAGSQAEPPSYGSGPPPQQQGGQPAPPPGPPPGHAPGRSETFKESDFVPASERGEQREAMEQFEMNKSGNESQTDRDVAELQSEFRGLDGSLIAALYNDAGNMGATREMLQELASQNQ